MPPQRLWTSTLTVGRDHFGGDLGTGWGYEDDVDAGALNPVAYEDGDGSTATFHRLLLLTDGNDRLYVGLGRGESSGVDGLWLKVADHLAVELGEPTDQTAFYDRWFFDLGDGALDWAVGDSVEVSFWDKRPPLSEPPPRPLWAATLWPSRDDFVPEGQGYGWVDNGIGVLDPKEYVHSSGSTSIDWLVVFTDGEDKLMLSSVTNTEALSGLWLKIGGLAFELDAASRSGAGNITFTWNIAEGSLDWSNQDSVEVSLWAAQPPGTEPPPRKLWTSTVTAGSDDYGTGFGTGIGFGNSVDGSMDPEGYEYESGSTATFFRMLLLADGDDRFYAGLNGKDHGSGLVGLWLKVADDLAFELGEPLGLPDGEFNDLWFFDIGDGVLDWVDNGTYEVSLWDKNPIAE